MIVKEIEKACAYNDYEKLELLLSNNKTNNISFILNRALNDACKKGFDKIVSIILNSEDFNFINNQANPNSFFISAIENHQLDILNILLKSKHLNKYRDNYELFLKSLQIGNVLIVKLLMNYIDNVSIDNLTFIVI